MANSPALFHKYIQQENTVLFAGAGVGKRIGLPDWSEYLGLLARACEEYQDQASAALIRQKITDGDLLGAATVYRSCKRIPAGERLKILAAPFMAEPTDEALARLEPLVGLGYSAIVTTNYDKSLHHAYARLTGRAPHPVERGDRSLRGANLRKEHFIARIHGRAEVPASLILSEADYDSLERDGDYMDFLMDLVKTRPCIFVGFSFDDPAFDRVLGLYERNYGPSFPVLHLALVSSADRKLASRLSALNIEVLAYDPANGHRELWQLLRDEYDAGRSGVGGRDALAAASLPPLPPTSHRLMAFAYSQLQTRAEKGPVTKAVHDGLVHSVVAGFGDSGGLRLEIADEVRRCLFLGVEESREVVDASLANLMHRGDVEERNGHLVSVQEPSSALTDHIAELAAALLVRMRVRERVVTSDVDEGAAKRLIERILMVRAWDVAAHFAGASTGGWAADIPRVVDRLVAEEQKAGTLSAPGAMARALLDLLRTPEDHEAELLTQLGRAAFGLQVILSTPRQSLLQRYSLPEQIYLDANIVLPAITEGYPLRPVYLDLLSRIATAAAQSGIVFKLYVGSPFIEEVLSHRQKAIELVHDQKLDDPRELARHVGFYSATNTNVFVGAYASFVGRNQEAVHFGEFLKRAAPYEDYDGLVRYLDQRGIEVMRMDYREMDHPEFRDIYNKLLEGYEGNRPWYERNKDTVLIVHEAQQLTRLRIDVREGVRSVFVTADARLRRIMLADRRLHDLLGATVTDIGLVALVDVMIGIQSDARAMARLLWAVPHDSPERAVFDYFIAVALREYEYAINMPMQEVASTIAQQAVSDAKVLRLDLLSNAPDDIARTTALLDRYENQFFRALDQKRR